VWTTDEQHRQIVKEAWTHHKGSISTKLHNTLNALHTWGSKTFGIIPKKIKVVQQELHTLQLNQENQNLTQQVAQKEKELDDLLEKEEMWWSQRAKALWLTHGDKNTKFFHQRASQRKRKNKIEVIKDQQNNSQTDREKIEDIFLNHFQLLFTTQNPTNITDITQVVNNRINQENYDHLQKDFTAEEVYQAIKDMKSLAAPGPDGLPARFYHTYWDIIGQDITKETLHILNNHGNPSEFNNTHICLIPKTNNPLLPSEFRPISLCNVTLKLITRTIAKLSYMTSSAQTRVLLSLVD
jgi:hypothetical protein